jgi:hypothetical protein
MTKRLNLSKQILELAPNKADIAPRVHAVIDKFADRGLRSLGVARQARTKTLRFFFLNFLSCVSTSENLCNNVVNS